MDVIQIVDYLKVMQNIRSVLLLQWLNPGDTIRIRSGTYIENNPIGLRTDVAVSGEDLRLVLLIPQNKNKDFFHVRRGCLIEHLSFTGEKHLDDHSNCGAVAFPPTQQLILMRD